MVAVGPRLYRAPMTTRALDPDAAAVLARIAAADAPPPSAGTPEQARAGHIASAPALAGPPEPVQQVRDDTVDGVPVRVYVPAGAVGTTVYLHGGGWVVGTLDTYDVLCRALANRSGSTVISVGYSLAPEARHPLQALQAFAVLRAVVAGGGPVAVAGDSAGAHLAALVSGMAVQQAVPVAAQALIYPVVDPALDTPSARENATGYYLETEAMRWYWGHYLPSADNPPHGTDVPVRPAARAGMAPALVLTAGFDPLRDEGIAYAGELASAGVPVQQLSYPGQIHGFVRMTGVIGEAKPALDQVGAFLQSHLRG